MHQQDELHAPAKQAPERSGVCNHCGTKIAVVGSAVCPNCDEDPNSPSEPDSKPKIIPEPDWTNYKQVRAYIVQKFCPPISKTLKRKHFCAH